jgi:hypothetical protein
MEMNFASGVCGLVTPAAWAQSTNKPGRGDRRRVGSVDECNWIFRGDTMMITRHIAAGLLIFAGSGFAADEPTPKEAVVEPTAPIGEKVTHSDSGYGASHPLDIPDDAGLFIYSADEDQQAKTSRDPVAPAKRSQEALNKVASKRLGDGSPAHSFQSLLHHLSEIVRNTCRRPGAGPEAPTFHRTTSPNAKQRQALDLLRSITV